MGRFRRSRKRRLWTGVALGITGGLAGSWLMNQSQTLMQNVSDHTNGSSEDQQQREPATVLAAEKLSQATTGSPLPNEKKKTAEPIVHYAFGALVGALYGGLAEKAPLVTLGAGTLYGATVGYWPMRLRFPPSACPNRPARSPFPNICRHWALISCTVWPQKACGAPVRSSRSEEQSFQSRGSEDLPEPRLPDAISLLRNRR